MKQSILIITYYYAPMLSARAFRWSVLAERWAAQGHRVDVVTAREGESAAVEELSGVHVYRVNNVIFELLRSRLVQSHKATEQRSPVVHRPTILSRLLSVVRWIYYHVFVNVYWPDAAFLWRRPAVQKALELNVKHHYHVLVSVSPPFTGHLAAERVYRRAGIKRWIADFGDPFSIQHIEAHNNLRLYGRLNDHVECRVLDQVHAVSVTTRSTSDLYIEHFPSTQNKIQVIPPLLSLAPITSKAAEQRDDDHLRFVFAGTFYPETRPPDFLLKLFAHLLQLPEWQDRLDLHFYGNMGQVREAFERHRTLIDQGRIVMHGLVNRDVVTQAMSQADILVNVGNKTYYQLPSKVIEYASMGKPILNIIQISNDSSQDVYADYPAVLNLLDSGEEAFEHQLNTLHQWLLHLPDVVSSEFLTEFLAQYRIESIGQAYDKLLFE